MVRGWLVQSVVLVFALGGCVSCAPSDQDTAESSLPSVCVPGATSCWSKGAISVCNADGTGTETKRVCDVGWSCVEQHGAADCVQDHCGAPGKKRCYENTTASCNAEHTYDADQDCGEQLCVDGECLALTCGSAEETLCFNAAWYDCTGRGAKPKQRTSCGPGSRCSGLDGHNCVADPCPASQTGCINNQLGVCSEDGVSLSGVSNDCAAKGQICDRNHECVDSTTDTLGPSETETSPDKGDTLSLAVVRVDSSRLLTRLDAHMTLEASTSVAWVIYEQETDGFALRLEDDAELGPGSDVFSSSPLEFQLEAERIYAIGFYLSDGSGCFKQHAPNDQLSFGSVIGWSFSGGGDYHQLQQIKASAYQSQLDLRLTTSAIPAK